MRSTSRRAFAVVLLLLAVAAIAQNPIDLNTNAKGSRMPYFGVDSGAANAYAISTFAPIGSGGVLQTGSRFYFYATHANTTASTLAVNGGSAKAIKKNVSSALLTGDILLNGLVEVVYDGTNFQLVGNGVFSGSVSCSQLPAFTGDTTTSAGSCATTTVKVNGVSYPASPSTHAVPVVTASNTATYKVVPDCTDTGGNHLNFTQSSDVFSCGTSGGSSSISGATANGAVYATGSTAATSTGALTNGQVLIGDTGNPPQANTIIAGAGIGVSNGAHSITISATGSTCSSGAPAVVGSIQASSGTPTTLSATIACNGSLVVIGITSASSATNPLTITGSCVSSWTLAKSSVANSNKAWLYYGKSNTTGACTISSNVTCSSCSMVEAELSNTNATVDKTLADYSNGTSSITTTLPALANTNDVVVSLLGGFHTGWTASPTAPLTSIVTFNNVDASNLAWYQSSSASAQSFNWGITCCGSLWWDDNVILNAAFSTSAGSAVFNQTVQVDGSGFAQEPVTDFVSGTGITLSGADDSANTRTKVTVNLSTPVTVANGGTGDATIAAHGVLVGAGTSPVIATGAGTSGQCFTSNGASSDPTFQTCGVGGSSGLTLVEQHTASSSAELDFTSCISSSYDEYEIDMVDIVPATNNVNVTMQMSTNGGSTYDATSGHYAWTIWAFVPGASGISGTNSDSSLSLVTLVNNPPANYSATGHFHLYNPASSSLFKQLDGTGFAVTANDGRKAEGQTLGAAYLSTTAVNAFRVLASSGNLTSGIVRCYGLAK